MDRTARPCESGGAGSRLMTSGRVGRKVLPRQAHRVVVERVLAKRRSGPAAAQPLLAVSSRGSATAVRSRERSSTRSKRVRRWSLGKC